MTAGERGRSWPEKVMEVMGEFWIWCGVPICMTSVLELFSCRKLRLIHALISSRQVVRVDKGRGDGEGCDGGVLLVLR